MFDARFLTIGFVLTSCSASVKEATTGYFEDYNKLRHEGGKDWIAPKTLIQEKVAYARRSRSAGWRSS